jgi:prolyl-tRNA editing enzyme YbaK/EbsC (Cys-tRNA(Pro) deacylase)
VSGGTPGPAGADAVARVTAALREAGVDPAVRRFAQGTRTSAQAAAAVGCDVAQIAKSIVFRLEREEEPPEALLVVASGRSRVDEAAVGALAGGRLEKADAAFVRERTGFAIGGVPATGHAHPIPVLFDEDLLAFDVVWSAAGTPDAVFPLAPGELVRITGARVARVAAR